MKLSKYILISMALSILVHLLLLKATAKVTLGHHLSSTERHYNPEDFYLPIKLFRDKPRPAPPKKEEQRQPDPSLPDLATIKRINSDMKREVRQLSGTRKVEAILQNSKLLEPPKARYRLDGVDKRRTLGPKLPEDVKPVLATAPRPEILEIDYSDLPKERQSLTNRIFTPKLEREVSTAPLLPSLTPHGELTSAFGGSYGLTVQTGYKPTFGAPDFDVAALSRGEDSGDSGSSLLDDAPSPLQGSPETDKSAGEDLPLPFDDFVDIQVRVVRDKSGSGGYFQVDIIPNASSDTMPDIAKDTLFVIDHSTSISHQKLEQFKLAAREALNCLNPRDGFNVVSFTTTAKPLFNVFAPITARNLNTASEYIASLWRGGMTDVFGSISPFVQQSNGDLNRPLNIFLLTDGQSTVNIYQAPEFLRQIVGLNPGNVSIYPFSAGRQANRQLLDFLGYLNRGSQCHVDEIEQLRPRLVEYITTHSSLVIMNLQYTAEGQVSQDIFPRALPHLYRTESLRLFGRFRNIDDELVLHLSGQDAELKTRDLIFRRRYRDCPAGSRDLSSEWAGQKILHLLSLRNCSVDEKEIQHYNAEIAALTRKYGVYAPY